MNIEPGFSREAISSSPSGLAVAEADTLEQRARQRRIVLMVGVGLVVLFAAIMLIRWLSKEQPAPEPPPRVTYTIPGREQVQGSISTTGTLAAKREMPVGVAGEGGMVTRVLVEPGDWVGAGQALALIDSSVQVQQANQLRAQIAAARANAKVAELELNRAQKLVSRGFVSQADVDRKTATRDAARAQVAVAQAQLGETQALIGRLSIRAPAAGLVLTRAVEPGQIVGSGNVALFRIAKGGEMELRAKMADSDLARLAIGSTVQVTPVGSNRKFVGHVWQLAPVVDPLSRQGEARIQIAFDKELRPGGFASAEIENGVTTVPLLAESAVLSDAKGNFVYLIGPDDKVVRRDVKVGSVSDAGLPIVSGLAGNEKVVLSAGAFLSPGDVITPIAEPKRK